MATYTLDDNFDGTDNGSFGLRNTSSNLEWANKFVPSITGDVGKAEIDLQKNNSPTGGNVFVKIYTDSSGSPGSLLGTSDGIDVTTLSASSNFEVFIFSTVVPVTASTTYWISIAGDFTINASNYVTVLATNPGYRGGNKRWDGSTWANAFGDYSIHFNEYDAVFPSGNAVFMGTNF